MGATLSNILMKSRVADGVRMYLVHSLSRVLFYWLPNYLLHIVARKGLCLHWKIQRGKSPRPELFSRALWHNVQTDLIGQLFVGIGFHWLLTLGRSSSRSSMVEDGQTDAQPQTDSADVGVPSSAELYKGAGWGRLRFHGPVPSLLTHVWQVSVAYFGYDFMFYWAHRLMHHRSLYKHCHKVHHQFHTSVGIACAHEHGLESLVQLFNWYLPIGFAGFLNRHNGGLHASTLFYYHCFRWIETVDAHCGYEFPFSPFTMVPIFGGARMHDYHHRAFDGNYGASKFWDWLCGTDAGFWQEVLEEGGFLLGGQRVPSLLQ